MLWYKINYSWCLVLNPTFSEQYMSYKNPLNCGIWPQLWIIQRIYRVWYDFVCVLHKELLNANSLWSGISMVSISIVIPGFEPRPHMQPSRTELQFKELTTIIFSKHFSLIYIFSYNLLHCYSYSPWSSLCFLGWQAVYHISR